MSDAITATAWADSFGRWYCRINLAVARQSDEIEDAPLRKAAKRHIEHAMAETGKPYKVKLEISDVNIDSNNRVHSVTFFESA